MSVEALVENAAQDMDLVCREIQEAHSQACKENPFLELLLLNEIRVGVELRDRLNGIVNALKEKK